MQQTPLSVVFRRGDPWRVVLLAIFLTLAGWRAAMPSDAGRFGCYLPADDARQSFFIPDDPQSTAKTPAAVPRKYHTFAHRALDIDAGEFPVPADRYALLDQIIDDARRRITYDATIADPANQRRQAEHVLRAIDQVLTDHNVLYPPGDYDVSSLRAGLKPAHYDRPTLQRILRIHLNQRRRGHALAHATEPFHILDCDTAAFVYVGIAQALGIELRLVDLPNHMFVRWRFADGSSMNWDTNAAATLPDSVYAADYALTRSILNQRVYLVTMTAREADGYLHFLRALRLEDRGQDDRAIADLQKALALHPQSTQAKAELAWLYAVTSPAAAQREQAVVLARSAVDLEPQNGDFRDSLAAAYAARGDFEQAAREARRAEQLAASRQDRADFRVRRRTYEKGQTWRPDSN